MKFGVRRVQCEVWSVECEDFASSLAEKKPLVEGRTRSGQVFLRTIGHLFLGNFRRRLARVYVIGNFCCKAYWATPFKMHFDFRPLFRRTFAELSRKYPYPQTPAISRGAHQRKKQTSGTLAFGSRKASLLEACLLHLELVS